MDYLRNGPCRGWKIGGKIWGPRLSSACKIRTGYYIVNIQSSLVFCNVVLKRKCCFPIYSVAYTTVKIK